MKRFEAVTCAILLSAAPLPASPVTWQELLNSGAPAEGLLEAPETFAEVVHAKPFLPKVCDFLPT